MSLLPLLHCESHEDRVRTILRNVDSVARQLYGSAEQAMAEKLRLMEYAVKIEDAENRQAFVNLINKWHSESQVRVDIRKDLVFIKEQLGTLEKHVGDSSKQKENQQ